MDQLMTELGALLGMPELALSGNGACELVFDGALAVTIAYQPQQRRIVLGSIVSGHHDAGLPHAFEAMLKGNHLWAATGGATLSLAQDRTVWLMRDLPLKGLAAPDLLTAIEQHINTLEQWATGLRSGTLSPQPSRLAMMERA